MTVRRRVHKLSAHPLTASTANLTKWLEMPPKRRQAELASACSVSQQTISDYKRRSARPDPGSELALLIEIATGGFVLAAGWLTVEEVRLRDENQSRAATFAGSQGHGPKPAALQAGHAPGARSTNIEGSQSAKSMSCCTTTTILRDSRTCQDDFGRSQEEAASSFVRRLNFLLEGVVAKFERRLDDLFDEQVHCLTPRSRAPASRPVAAGRRRPHRALMPQSSRPASIPTPARPSAAHARQALLDPQRLTPLVGDDEAPPSTERSDPPTQPSPSIRSLPSPIAVRGLAVEVVENKRDEAPPYAGHDGDAVPPPSATRGTIAVADAIETLSQRRGSIRLEGKE
ncbi:MAG: hypothetical protein ABJE95_38265 [Byssovorax sp.]